MSTDAEPWSWLRPRIAHAAPAGQEWRAVRLTAPEGWRVTLNPRKCGYNSRGNRCDQTAVAEMTLHPLAVSRNWRAYCERHTLAYGCWVEDGCVYHWALVPVPIEGES